MEENKVKVTGVRFKAAGKVYYFDPGDLTIALGDKVIVETARGLEYGTVASAPMEVSDQEIVAPLKQVLRLATEEDARQYQENLDKKAEAMRLCQEKIDKHGLVMKLIDAEYTFDHSKVIFYFTADGRVDFRDLVKDLASVFRMRIELRQVGVRDEAKMMGGIGGCGRGLCCHNWLADFEPVSIKMAKVQNLSLNPTKISGICGRLMCCLKYENDVYMALRKGMPEIGERVRTPDGYAKVVDTNLLKGTVKVRLFIEEKPSKESRHNRRKKDKEEEPAMPAEEKLSSELSVYQKEDIRRIEKRRERNVSDRSLFEGMDAETVEEIQQLIKD